MDAQLTRNFVSPDRETWVKAAHELGAQAVQDPEARAFIESCLSDERQLHRRRHALAAQARWYSEATGTSPVMDALVTAAVHGTEGELAATLPQLKERIETWSISEQAKLQKELDALEAKGAHPKALESKKKKLAALAAGDTTGFVSPKAPRLEPWDIASWLAGVTGPAALAGLPIDAITRGLIGWTSGNGASGIGRRQACPHCRDRR